MAHRMQSEDGDVFLKMEEAIEVPQQELCRNQMHVVRSWHRENGIRIAIVLCEVCQ